MTLGYGMAFAHWALATQAEFHKGSVTGALCGICKNYFAERQRIAAERAADEAGRS